MKNYIGILTNTLVDLNGIKMSDEAIKEILDQQPKVPVTINFGGLEVGQTNFFSLDNDKGLLCEFAVDETKHDLVALIDRMFVVPSLENVEFHYEGRTRVIEHGDLTEVTLTGLPANMYLQPIKPKGDKDESA